MQSCCIQLQENCSGAMAVSCERKQREGGEDKVLDHMLLDQLLSGLGQEERKLIYLRYFADRTQSQVGEEMGISQVQVSRLEKKILKQMREKI